MGENNTPFPLNSMSMPHNVLDLTKSSKDNEPRPEQQHVLAEWEADEYEHTPKRRVWFIVLWLITLAMAAAAFFLGNYLFAVLILIAGSLLGWFATMNPKKVHFAITVQGLEIGGKLYAFDDLRSFCVFYDPPVFQELSIESRKVFMPRIRVPLGASNLESLRKILVRFLPEEKHDQSLISLIIRAIGL